MLLVRSSFGGSNLLVPASFNKHLTIVYERNSLIGELVAIGNPRPMIYNGH
jgi:hypothetical protein